MICNLGNFDS